MLQNLAVRWTAQRTIRAVVLLAWDALATQCALYSALYLRLNARSAPEYAEAIAVAAPILVCMRLLSVIVFRLHRWSFRMPGFSEAVRLVLATAGGSAVFVTLSHFLALPHLPRTVVALEFFISTTLFAGFRYAPRLVNSLSSEWHRKNSAMRTIIVGAGNMGDLLGRDLRGSPDSKHYVVGYVDDSPKKLHTSLNGKPVLGKINRLAALIESHGVSMVLLAIANMPAEKIRDILAMCSKSKAKFKIIPSSFSYMDQRITAAMLHDLEPEDLLPRESIEFNYDETQRLVRGRRVLVTGAGGSIGGEICRQIAMHGAAQLVMVDMNENQLYLSERRLREEYPDVQIQSEVADIREPARLKRLGECYRPQYVFHAAAHKHVPLMEDAPEEAIKNNVFGSLNVAQMAHECGAERMVLISSDKAVKPSSVMGASKRIAELALRDFARRSSTKFTAVRFGNVLGSAGSVIPIFKDQIERGGPVTVTHPDCRRYFMTIPEAVGLVLIAGLGGYGELCVLDMGEPIKIADLAANLITMAGYVPDEEIEIKFTGLRPGEKLFEELFTEEEEQTHKVRNRIMVAEAPVPPSDLPDRLGELWQLAAAGDRAGILRKIKQVVPTFKHTLADGVEAAIANAEPELGQVVPFRKAAGDYRI